VTSAGDLAEVHGSEVVEMDRGLWVYAVVPATAEVPPELTGVDGGGVELVPSGRVAAAVGWIDLERPPARRAELLAYHAVVDALSEAGPAAPVRFGSVLPDAQTVAEEFLDPVEEDFAQLLAELEGRRQFNLRASYVEEVVLSELVLTDPEIGELREWTRNAPEDVSYRERVRLGELVAVALEARGSDDAALILDTILPYTAGHVLRQVSAFDVLDVALLVDTTRSEELEGVLEELAEAVHERIRLRLVGPMAPYDFTGGD
jgi:hypothetical protein